VNKTTTRNLVKSTITCTRYTVTWFPSAEHPPLFLAVTSESMPKNRKRSIRPWYDATCSGVNPRLFCAVACAPCSMRNLARPVVQVLPKIQHSSKLHRASSPRAAVHRFIPHPRFTRPRVDFSSLSGAAAHFEDSQNVERVINGDQEPVFELKRPSRTAVLTFDRGSGNVPRAASGSPSWISTSTDITLLTSEGNSFRRICRLTLNCRHLPSNGISYLPARRKKPIISRSRTHSYLPQLELQRIRRHDKWQY
jgi:hypothetical protein